MAHRGNVVPPRVPRRTGGRWHGEPSLRVFIVAALRLGGTFGALLGFLPVFFSPQFIWDAPNALLFIFLGAIVGATYGLVFALAAWPVGLLLVEKWRLVSGKGLGLGIGVTLTAAVAIAATWPARGLWGADSVDSLVFVFVPGVIGTMVAIVAGVRYDRTP